MSGSIRPVSDNWLDSVLAVPSIGLQLRVPPSVVRRANHDFGAFLDHLHLEHDQLLVSEGANASTPDGFSYRLALDASGYHVIVQFQHKALEDRDPGELPGLSFQMANTSTTELIDIAHKRLRKLVALTKALDGAALKRIGLNVRVQMSLDQLPPGVVRFRNALASPWETNQGGELRKSNTNLLVRLKQHSSDERWEQCHHGLDFEVDGKIREYTCLLDYQRVWKESTPLSEGLGSLDKFIEIALRYFQDFAFSENPWPPL